MKEKLRKYEQNPLDMISHHTFNKTTWIVQALSSILENKRFDENVEYLKKATWWNNSLLAHIESALWQKPQSIHSFNKSSFAFHTEESIAALYWYYTTSEHAGMLKEVDIYWSQLSEAVLQKKYQEALNIVTKITEKIRSITR